ncbi:hypothetical protein GCM10023195_35190 [Actinoallomurus liliacearum]|uniref:Uncharacterized protein n=1 Tax=Actinoallomurus liliacearum TaxID=1080073 RepID=A0ABP8TI58_9ACTN
MVKFPLPSVATVTTVAADTGPPYDATAVNASDTTTPTAPTRRIWDIPPPESRPGERGPVRSRFRSLERRVKAGPRTGVGRHGRLRTPPQVTGPAGDRTGAGPR